MSRWLNDSKQCQTQESLSKCQHRTRLSANLRWANPRRKVLGGWPGPTNLDGGQGGWTPRAADGVADGAVGKASNSANVTRLCLLSCHPGEILKDKHLVDLAWPWLLSCAPTHTSATVGGNLETLSHSRGPRLTWRASDKAAGHVTTSNKGSVPSESSLTRYTPTAGAFC